MSDLGGVCSQGVSTPGGWGCVIRGCLLWGCLLLGGGLCALGGLSAPGGCLLPGGGDVSDRGVPGGV